MNTFAITLVALVMGFVAGTVAALVTVEVKTESIRKEIEDSIKGLEYARADLKSTHEYTKTVNLALQQFLVKYKADRTWIMQSLNDLWNICDTLKPVEVKEEVAEEVTAPKKTRKPRKKKTEEVKETTADAE